MSQVNPPMKICDLNKDEIVDLGFNVPVRFRMEFIDGSYVEGTIPANERFKVLNKGGIAKFELAWIDDVWHSPRS